MKRINNIKGMVFAIPFLWLMACSNDPTNVSRVVQDYDGPLRIQHDVEYQYSDSGAVMVRFTADVAYDYSHLEKDPYLEFNEGLDVIFFDKFGNETSNLRADYAIRHISTATWEARGNVVVINLEEEEKLNTEKLIWDEESRRIRSDEFVKITTPESIIMGEGFEADQNMDNYEIYDVTGIIYLDESDADTTTTNL